MTQEKWAVELDEAELACLIMEAMIRLKRPPGISARDAIDSIKGQEAFVCSVRLAAHRVADYVEQQINAKARVQ